MAFKLSDKEEKARSPSPYELVYLDADTPLFKAAKSVQTDYVIVRHKETDWEQRFSNITEFWGHHKKKEGGWLAKVNESKLRNKLPLVKPEDFEYEPLSELSEDIEDHLSAAIEGFDRFIGKVKRLNFAEDYRIVLGGDHNFRYEVAHIQPYKGKRAPKPLLFQEVKDAIKGKYKSKIIIAEDGEADDVLGTVGFENYKNFLATGKWRDCLGFIDKDLKMIISPQFNYDDPRPEIFIPTAEDAARHFVAQCLAGDSTDNILGVPNFTKEITEKYGLGSTRGVGLATAFKLLPEGISIKQMFERVVEAYRSYYGTEKEELISFRGDKMHYNYMDYLQEAAILLWMQREKGERYDIKTTLDRLGIDYGY